MKNLKIFVYDLLLPICGNPDVLKPASVFSCFTAKSCKAIKIMAAKRSNGRNGKYVSSIAPYGYRKSETDKGVWEVDLEAAEIVKRIFRMTIEGYGTCAIANRLRKDKIHSSGYYHAQRGIGACKNKAFDDP